MRFLVCRALAPALLLAATAAGAQERAVPLDTLQVTAASRASAEMATATRAVEVITAEQIRRMPVRSVAEVLQWALAVDLMPRSPALADVAVRGSSYEQVLVMVDGVRASDAQTGHFDLDLAVPLDQVERIEVLRGPASTLHGADAMGGVINVVTRAGAGPTARVETGSFDTRAVALSHTLPLGAARLDLATDLRRSDGHRPGTDFEIGLGRVALSAPLGGRTLRADAGYAFRGFGADRFYAPFPSYEETRALTASVAWRGRPGARLSVEPVLSARRHHDDFILKRADPAFYRNRHATLQAGGELTARYLLSPQLHLAAGAEAFQDRLESARLGDRAESRAALLGEVAAGRVGWMTATAGVRMDWHEAFGRFWSPSLATAWWPAERLRLRASLGRALRTPTWTERFYRDPANIGDPDLDPESAWSREAGVDAYPWGGVRVGASAWVREARDLIDWARPAGASTAPWRTRNVEDATFRGVEAELSVDDALGVRWTGQGSWISLRSTEAPGFTSKYALRPLVRTLSLAAERELAPGVDATVRAQQAKRMGESPYLRVDVRTSFALSRARVYLDLQNAGGARYPDITGADAPGRAILAGLEWRGGARASR